MLATTQRDSQALMNQLRLKIPEKKRLKDVQKLRSRRIGHTLYGEKKDYTEYQQAILSTVLDEGLYYFDGKRPRQTMLWNWAVEASFLSGNDEDILLPEVVKYYVEKERANLSMPERWALLKRVAKDERDYARKNREKHGIHMPAELRSNNVDTGRFGRGIFATADDVFRPIGITNEAIHEAGFGANIGAQPAINGHTPKEEEGEPEFRREGTVGFKREPTYFSGQAGGEQLSPDEFQALQQDWNDEVVKAFLLDPDVGNPHLRFGQPLMSGKFSKQEESKYLIDAAGSMTPDEQRLLLQYIAQRKRSGGSRGGSKGKEKVKREQVSPPPPSRSQIPTLPQLVQLSRDQLAAEIGRMNGNEIGTILSHVPSDLRGLLGHDWAENLKPTNLQRYNLTELKDLCGGLVLEIQSQLEKLQKEPSPGGQSGQSGPGGMDVDT